jgi:hypothetical protein
MKYLNLHNRIHKMCALGAATLILPVVAYADHESGKGNKGDNDRQRWGEKDEYRWADHDGDKDKDFQPVGFHSSAVLLDQIATRDTERLLGLGAEEQEKDEYRWADHDGDKDKDFQPVGFRSSAVLPHQTDVFSMTAPPITTRNNEVLVGQGSEEHCVGIFSVPDAGRILSVGAIGNQISSVPEGGPGMVLLATTVGAILLFSARLSSTAVRKP